MPSGFSFVKVLAYSTISLISQPGSVSDIKKGGGGEFPSQFIFKETLFFLGAGFMILVQ